MPSALPSQGFCSLINPSFLQGWLLFLLLTNSLNRETCIKSLIIRKKVVRAVLSSTLPIYGCISLISFTVKPLEKIVCNYIFTSSSSPTFLLKSFEMSSHSILHEHYYYHGSFAKFNNHLLELIFQQHSTQFTSLKIFSSSAFTLTVLLVIFLRFWIIFFKIHCCFLLFLLDLKVSKCFSVQF